MKGDHELKLTFRSFEMNDVLKSLTLYDLDGGTIHSVSYDAQKPVEKLLQEVALDIPAQGGGAALLAQIRGARVELKAGSRQLTGRVVGVRAQPTRSADGVTEAQLLSLLDEDGHLHTVDLAECSDLQFLDAHIRKDLEFYFETLVAATKRDAKTLSVHARGKGQRKIQLSYVVECPVWKTSYRVALPEEESDQPFLQGWALIDNTHDEDWEDVELSLVAGLPVSFVHDLYSPRYIERQMVEVEEDEAAVAPAKSVRVACKPPAGAVDAIMMREELGGGGAPQPEVQTQSLGELFEYKLEHPVTVRRNQSALVPIVSQSGQGRRVTLYNRQERARNPFAALEFTNTTGLTLEGGPMVVYDGDTYAGEAMLALLQPDEVRLVPYAVDLGCEVDCQTQHKQEDVHLVVASEGVLHLHYAFLEHRVHRFLNKDNRAKTCILEHPIRQGAELYKTPAPITKAVDRYRFEVKLEPNATTEFTISERIPQSQVVKLAHLTSDKLEVYIERGYIEPDQQPVLRELMQLAQSLTKLTQKQERTHQEIKTITSDQERLRANLATLGPSHDEGRLRTRYVATLEQQENQLDQKRALLE
ncbi:MAG: hypothetical protein KC910_29435, partial [Candidatus Eremiobacteraeota bacterium]|nr:hypothetical protein [Candidatus Eremiobacteraeota bacterium]